MLHHPPLILPHPLPLNPDPTRLSPIILHQLREPRVLQRLAGCDALLRVVDKDLSQEIKEELVESGGGRDDLFEALHGADKFAGLPRSVGEWVGEVRVLEETRGAVTVGAFGGLVHFADQGLVDWVACYGL